jgi:hypothetical protein
MRFRQVTRRIAFLPLTGSTSPAYCREGLCASFPPSNIGDPCTNDNECVGTADWHDAPPFCAGPPGEGKTCGGASAVCTDTFNQPGYSAACASSESVESDVGRELIVGQGYCVYGECTRVDAVPGQACQANYDCPRGLTCVQRYCTGGEGNCEVDDNLLAIGASNDCASGFCRSGFSANFPGAAMRGTCDEDRDCAAAVETDGYSRLVNCGRAGSGNRRCGSGGAACVGSNAASSGDAPGLCISGEYDLGKEECMLTCLVRTMSEL